MSLEDARRLVQGYVELVNLFHPLRGAAGAGFWRAYRVDLAGFAKG